MMQQSSQPVKRNDARIPLNKLNGELKMQVYRVGGAIRDMLLNFPSVENDWVVVGATPSQLINLKYRPVGRDFPVFIHPKTGEEYALARTEMKTGKGYKGFNFYAHPSVKLEQDLMRRDLTINAIAEDSNGMLIDPYNGQRDLRKKVLRHVSPSFVEDPLRVLRTARFAARYHHLGFSVADETMQLMLSVSESNELDYLTPERVWKETEKALLERSPQVYINTLRKCGALKRLFPEIDQLFAIQSSEHGHGNRSDGCRTLMALEKTAELSQSGPIRFAVLVHRIGEIVHSEPRLNTKSTPLDERVTILKALFDRLKTPKKYHQLGLTLAMHYKPFFEAPQLDSSKLLKLVMAISEKSSTCKFENFLLCCSGISNSTRGGQDKMFVTASYIRSAIEVVNSVMISDTEFGGLHGREIGQEIKKLQLAMLKEFKQNFFRHNRLKESD
jgi:tRNA nucleotidyltransferase (CCA-adding enzyme)